MELPPPVSSSTLPVSHWTIFPGRSAFFCNGRLHTSRNWFGIPCVLALMLIPTIFHLIFDGPYLFEHVTIALPILGSIVLVFAMSNYLRCAFMDPGFLPRATPYETVYLEKQNNLTVDLSGAYYPTPKVKTIQIRDSDYDSKFCITCKFYRPPRAVHCSVCNMCVDRFDHHCPWVSNCVGARNYKHFYMFLVFAGLLGFYGFGASATCLGLRIAKIQPTTKAFEQSVVSIVVGVISFILFANLVGMGGAHTYFMLNERTTNERIKTRRVGSKGKTVENPFTQGSMLRNFVYLLCGSVPPSKVKLRAPLPSDYYARMPIEQAELRTHNQLSSSLHESLLPIPGVQLYDQLMSRHHNQQLSAELTLLNDNYVNRDAASTAAASTATNVATNASKPLAPYEQVTRHLIQDERLNFCYEGYDQAKRYINVSLIEDKSKFWRMLFDLRINNVVLLEDRSDETKFSERYSFLYDRNITSKLDVSSNLSISFGAAYRYTNFSINTFHVRRLANSGGGGNNSSSTSLREHEVRIYRFWAYELTNHVPSVTCYFLKLLNLINMNNPVFNKSLYNSKANPSYPRDPVHDERIANYILLSDRPQRLFSFMVCDHVSDEMRFSGRLCTENAFKMFQLKQRHRVLDQSSRIGIDHYLFCMTNAFSSVHSTSDVQVGKMSEHLDTVSRIGFLTKKPILFDQMNTLLKAAFVDRSFRNTFTVDTGDPLNWYKFSLYDTNDLTVMLSPRANADTLIRFLVSNSVDLIIDVNQTMATNDDAPLFAGLQRVKLLRHTEKNVNDQGNGPLLRLKQNVFTVNLSNLFAVDDDENESSADADENKSENSEFEWSVTHASVNNSVSLLGATSGESSSSSSGRSASVKREYSKESVDCLSQLLLAVLCDTERFHERIVLVCSDERLAQLIAQCIVNTRTAQVEKIMNINMGIQSVLVKMPRYDQPLSTTSANYTAASYASHFKALFDYAEYELVYKVCTRIATALDQKAAVANAGVVTR